MQNPYNITNTYSPRGVNFPDGVRVGNFLLPGSQSTSRGISVIEPVVWSVQPFAAQTFFEQTFAFPGTYKLDLSNASLNPSNLSYIWSGNQMVLDCERTLLLIGSEEFSVKVSGLTQYNQKNVCSGSSSIVEDTNAFITGRGFRALTNITVTIVNPNTTISVRTTNKLVLPFSTAIPTFLNSRYVYTFSSIVYSTLFKCRESSEAPYDLIPNFSLINETNDEIDMLPNSGTPRPILNLFNNPVNYPIEFNNFSTLTMEFMVNTAGYNPVLKYPSSNNKELTIGIEPYSVGWEG